MDDFEWADNVERTIYILEGSSGSWDDYGTFIIRVFDSREKATEYQEKYDRVVGSLSKWVSECWSTHNDWDDDQSEWYHTFEFKIWDKYHFTYGEYNGSKIVEHKLY